MVLSCPNLSRAVRDTKRNSRPAIAHRTRQRSAPSHDEIGYPAGYLRNLNKYSTPHLTIFELIEITPVRRYYLRRSAKAQHSFHLHDSIY